MNLSSNLQAVLFIAGLSLIVGGVTFIAATLAGLILADPEPPTTKEQDCV